MLQCALFAFVKSTLFREERFCFQNTAACSCCLIYHGIVIICSRTTSPWMSYYKTKIDLIFLYQMDYQYTSKCENNTFILILKQLCKMMTLTHVKWQPKVSLFKLPSREFTHLEKSVSHAVECTARMGRFMSKEPPHVIKMQVITCYLI